MKRKKSILNTLRDQLTIQAASTTYDGVNQEIETWADEQTVFCAKKDRNTGDAERYAGDMQVVLQTVDFIIRYQPELNEKKRIVWRSNVYDILNLRVDDRNEFQTVTCQLRK